MLKTFTLLMCQAGIAIAALSLTANACADNFAECLLEKLPGVQSQPATNAALQICKKKYPANWASVEQGSGLGFFAAYDSGYECALDIGRDTQQRQAAFLITKACKLLYDERVPGLFDDLE
ncbi:hypothetical protein [uncultured Pseudomonas sp.]|uniref:hypothetical protein n=1 Tax=uncultured Pseudomonas sp. TaxID=114707 RepID=UPI0030DD3523|tara:strand:- start:51913 stop:52275 length:363 start_codon:yes stop_codon:yes gene_type:complete